MFNSFTLVNTVGGGYVLLLFIIFFIKICSQIMKHILNKLYTCILHLNISHLIQSNSKLILVHNNLTIVLFNINTPLWLHSTFQSIIKNNHYFHWLGQLES